MCPYSPRAIRSDSQACQLKTEAGTISYVLCKSIRRRTIAISVSESTDVRVHAPKSTSEQQIRAFIHEKSRWILAKVKEAKKVQDFLNTKQYTHGNCFLFLGRKYPLALIEEDRKTAKIFFDGAKWEVKLPASISLEDRRKVIRQKLIAWYKEQAKEILGARVFYCARLMGLEPYRVAVKSQKRIWGSCVFHEKTINLNFQIVLAPMDVIDYVITHELAHLTFPNHGKRFWKKVEKFMPDYKKRKQWLLDNRYEMALPA